MRFSYFLILFIILSFNVFASWQTYQNDLRNTGISNEIGYFPLITTNLTSNVYGMDFQPLVGDLDKNGNNEIVIFSNKSLIIFGKQLNVMNQIKVGMILGQPALFNFDDDDLIEIVFNARQNSSEYFFAYQYNNSNLNQEFNITLQNNANLSGIKCLDNNGNNECVFKDKRNYINIVDMSSRTDSLYNTSVYNETRETVPAIGDIDNDGRQEAVFWFNEDDSEGYGFLVFDLGNRSLETNFNHTGKVDDIFIPLVLGPSEYHHLFMLKGQPVLVDLNNDNKLEIAASVFYNDIISGVADDWYTELFVYNYNGSKLFSKCESSGISATYGCNDGSSGTGGSHTWEGTNPVVIDADNNGIDDICFVKDVKTKTSRLLSYMGLSCYNYNGTELLNVNLSSDENSIRGTAMTADMNNDGRQELIISHNIYTLNGKSIFDAALYFVHPVAVDIDGNNGLDLVWTYGNQTKVFLDSDNYTVDLSVDSSDISFFKYDDERINVSVIARNLGQIEAKNVKIAVFNQETLENNTAVLSVRGKGNASFDSIMTLKEGDGIFVTVDYDNAIKESDESNNAAFREFFELPYVFVSSEVEPFAVNPEYVDYIRNKLTSGYYTNDQNRADFVVLIGKNNQINNVNNQQLLDELGIGYDYGSIIYNDKMGLNPYSGLIATLKTNRIIGNDVVYVTIVGNDIEGEIAAIKEFIKNQALFLTSKETKSIFIDDENADAIKVYDYLHLGGNNEHYKANNNEFKTIVRNALNDAMFTVEDKTIVTSNDVTLRLRNLKPNVSSDYLEYLSSNGMPVDMPVVLAHGLFSNLTTWEVLGSEISNTGRDTWLIEITGGPSQDCDDCIDYTFYNLTDIFVPELLNGVLSFTGKDKLQYVGFSNGCRAALDSLERNQFDSNKIETFVAVGCPGAFEGNSTFGNIIASKNGQISERLKAKSLSHVTTKDIIFTGLLNRNYPSKAEEKISFNLWKFYEDIITFKNDTQPGNINVSNFVIVQGSAFGTDDEIVTVLDQQKIYENANKNYKSKKRFDIFAVHTGLDAKDRTKSIVKKSVNKEQLSFYERIINLINQSE